MSYSNETFVSRILELLNYPLIDGCPELGILFDRCSIRELQEVFPSVVNSIFGVNSDGIGWGLRTITRNNAPQLFDILLNFFTPLGPMFRLCYRLLNDTFKFELNINRLPQNLNEMLVSGNYPVFYVDLIQVDPFRRCVSSLYLNAFDYFIINFVIYGTMPLHRTNPVALEVHNEKSKTIYFFLVAEYLSSFLPSNPDAVILPTNICGAVKAPQPVPVQPLKPTRSPKCLKLSVLSHFSSPNQSNSHTPESPRANAWRTESVLYFFTDIWLRLNVDEMRDLPSSEFVRVSRILVKQLHAFGSTAGADNTSMVALRKLAEPMMKARMYPFLRSLISRWPLDSSLLVVLELWLSYIQPWRYDFFCNLSTDTVISSRYEPFISENLVTYTQIFIEVLQRFMRLDFTSYRNVVMLSRLTKVFTQTNLSQILKTYEQKLMISMTQNPTTRSQLSPNHSRGGHSFYGGQTSPLSVCKSGRSGNIYQEENYIPMFGDSVHKEIQQLLRIILTAKALIHQEIQACTQELANQNRQLNFIKRILKSISDESCPLRDKINELEKIPDILDTGALSIGFIFNVKVDLSEVQVEDVQQSFLEFDSSTESEPDFSRISPIQMKSRAMKIRPTIDPALIPIQSYECALLVRFLHQLSCKLNLMFQREIIQYWNRRDIWGRIARQIFYPPMTTEWFDKSKGISELRQDLLPPRICLRPLASYKTLTMITLSLIFGQWIWGFPSFGLFFLGIFLIMYLFVVALVCTI